MAETGPRPREDDRRLAREGREGAQEDRVARGGGEEAQQEELNPAYFFAACGTNSGGSCAPGPKKNLSACSNRSFCASGDARLRRYSFRIIFAVSVHIFHASCEISSKIRWP